MKRPTANAPLPGNEDGGDVWKGSAKSFCMAAGRALSICVVGRFVMVLIDERKAPRHKALRLKRKKEPPWLSLAFAYSYIGGALSPAIVGVPPSQQFLDSVYMVSQYRMQS